jgi:hypothetical protein
MEPSGGDSQGFDIDWIEKGSTTGFSSIRAVEKQEK